MLPATDSLRPVHKSVAVIAVPLWSPMSCQLAVIAAVLGPIFSSRATTSPPASGPAHTCRGIDAFTSGGGGGAGDALEGEEARHQGTLAGKSGIIGSSWFAPFSMFVMAELSCPREFRYHSCNETAGQRQATHAVWGCR